MLTERKNRACDLFLEQGFDKALIGDPMSIYYLTGIHIVPYERFYGLVIDVKNKECTMINPSVDAGCMKGEIKEVTYLDSDGPQAVIQTVIGNCEKLAVDMKYFSMMIGQMLQNFSCKTEDLGDCIAKLRMKKDEKEIAELQYAAKIVDEALLYVSDKIKPGMTETQLQMMLFSYMTKYPGFIMDEFIIYVLGASKSANPHGKTSSDPLKEGDIILIDFCAYYNYYWSDITRCLFLGKPKEEKIVEIYEIVLQANLAAIAAVKPGAKAKDIDFAARDLITKAGYGGHFIHRTGHGLGLSVHEEPYITSVNELVLEEGMTFTIEPGIYLEGIGGVRIEDDILVTKDGCKVLTTTSKRLEDHILKF